jgi:hypothetical protein
MRSCLFDASISQNKTRCANKNKKTAQGTGEQKDKLKTQMCEFLEFGSKLVNGSVVVTLPLRTVSEANCFEPWQKRHKRHKTQKKAVFFALIEHKSIIQLPCRLTFIRYAPKFLDKHDNLPMSLKYIVDQTCAEITGELRAGKADDNELISIQYDQVKSKIYGVKIFIEFNSPNQND